MDATKAGEDYPVIEGDFVHVNGETHILNTDTDILKLDDKQESAVDLLPNDLDGEIVPTSGTENSEEEDEIELSPDGILDEETVGRGLSNLGRSADGAHQVYLHCAIPGFNLKDISILAEYLHLQKLEIPYNEITDLSALSNLQNLLILDASHNQISQVLNFTPPKNLQIVDLSYNQIEEMSDLSAHHSLKKLNLDNNKIFEIRDLEKCQRLSDLSLAHNKIEKIQGLDRLPLQHLNLCHNVIQKIENLESLKYLRQVNLSGNKIRSLEGLEDHDLMEAIDLEDNEVIDISEIKFIQQLRMFRQLNLLRNPIQELPDYRLSILFRIQCLTELDRRKVEVEEKVAAKNMFDPPPEVVAARDHIMHVVYSFLQPSRVWDSTLPNIETLYPMLVLVGPQGSGKKELALKLVEEFSDYFGHGVSHTTRNPYPEEVDGKDYHFISLDKFEMDIKMGQFLQTNQCNDNWYGLQMESVESVAREGLACVVHMEIEGVLTLKNTYFEPRYVLVMPLSREAHEKRLRECGIYTESQIENTLQRADMYCSYNQDHPGFFDMMIDSDDIQEAYCSLRKLIMDYLGISSFSPGLSEPTYAGTPGITDAPGIVEPYTTGPATTNQLGGRTWSKPSIPDSMSQSRGRVASPAIMGRGIVEEESLRRRHSAAKEAVTGYVPPLYEQLLTNYPKTAPQTVDGHVGLGDASDQERSFSAPANQVQIETIGVIPLESPDSSSDDGTSSSGLSDLDSATDLQRTQTPPELSRRHNGYLPTEKIDPLELIGEEGIKCSSNTQIPEVRPLSAPRPDSQNRPGSDRHKVLPPIQTSPPQPAVVQY